MMRLLRDLCSFLTSLYVLYYTMRVPLGGGWRLVRQVKTAKPSIYHFQFGTRQCSELDGKPEKVKYKDGKTLSAVLIRKMYILN